MTQPDPEEEHPEPGRPWWRRLRPARRRQDPPWELDGIGEDDLAG